MKALSDPLRDMDWHDEQDRMILGARLAKSSPEVVYQELKRAAAARTSRFGRLPVDEASLLGRNDPLINLALAAFGTQSEVLETLRDVAIADEVEGDDSAYKRSLRTALLSNLAVAENTDFTFYPRICGIDFIKNIIADAGRSDELTALIRNPNVPDKVLEDLYGRAGAFSEAGIDQWRFLIQKSAGIERLNDERTSIESDGDVSFDTGYLRIHKAIFRLLETAPVDKYWSYCLIELLRHLVPFYDRDSSMHVPLRIDHVLKRWTDVGLKDEDKGWNEGYLTGNPLATELRCLIASRYPRIEGQKQPGSSSSKDIALRVAFYARSDLPIAEMKAANERDKAAYQLAAMSNPSILTDRMKREFFEKEQLCFVGERGDKTGRMDSLDELYVRTITHLAKMSSSSGRDLMKRLAAAGDEIDGVDRDASVRQVAASFRKKMSFGATYFMLFLNGAALAFAGAQFGYMGSAFVLALQTACVGLICLDRRKSELPSSPS